MVECSLCSVMSFFCSSIYNIIIVVVEYPTATFLFSLLVAVVVISNVHSARLICNFVKANASSCRPIFSNTTTNCYDYGNDNGPHNWHIPTRYNNQSPINIIHESVVKLSIRELLTWNHYDDLPHGIMMQNNGHTVVVRAAYSGNVPTLSGADLLASYTFVEISFRWSFLNSEGSEHMINYRKFPLELQAMHRTGVGECISSYDLLMIAYFFEISASNPYLDPIIQNLHRIQRPGSKIEIPPFPLSYLCHQFRTGFFSYGGSLTEPPCYEGAEWFIFPEPLAISERQLNEFRMLLSSDGRSRILRNSRPVQNICSSRIVNLNQYQHPEVTCNVLEPISDNAENTECTT